MQHVYDELNKIEILQGKMVLHEKEEYIRINFHEYLHLDADDDMISVNGDSMHFTHWHPVDEADIIETITKIANGDLVFVENRNYLTYFIDPIFFGFRMMDKKKYEKKKEKYASRKSLRVYTGNAILKRNTRWW